MHAWPKLNGPKINLILKTNKTNKKNKKNFFYCFIPFSLFHSIYKTSLSPKYAELGEFMALNNARVPCT